MKPLVTEKAVMMIETNNTISFKVDKALTKPELKKQIEELFGVKVDKVKTQIKNNQKHAYVKLKKEFPAIDVATKLGII